MPTSPLSSIDTRKTTTRGQEMRTLLLSAALDAFAESTYEAMSVRELTRRLNVSHNIVHHHFGSKKDLWCAAMEYGLANAKDELVVLYNEAAKNSEPDPKKVIRNTIKQAILLFSRFPAIPRILAIESAHPSERLDFLFEHFIRPVSDAFTLALNSSRDKRLRKLDPRIVTLYVIGGVPSLFTHAALAEKLDGLNCHSAFMLDHYSETIAEILACGLVE